jgi:hypothetical protein
MRLADFIEPYEQEIQEELESLRATVIELRTLLREVAPKCDHYQNYPTPEVCTELATWWGDDDCNGVLYYCEEHRYDGVGMEPFDLGVRIKAALEE